MSRQMCLRCADPLSEGFGVLAKAPSGKRDFQPATIAAVNPRIQISYPMFRIDPFRVFVFSGNLSYLFSNINRKRLRDLHACCSHDARHKK
jgi:hypothetical protein